MSSEHCGCQCQPEKPLDRRYSLVVFFTAFLSAGMGIGGGSILIPVLLSFFYLKYRKAAAVSLTTIVPIAFVGAVTHLFFNGSALRLEYLLYFFPGCLVGAVSAGPCLDRFRTPYLKLSFAAYVLLVSLKMLDVVQPVSRAFDVLSSMALQYDAAFVLSLFGLLVGFLSVVLGVGCGLVIVPFFVIVFGIGIHEAITISFVSMFFFTLTGFLIHRRHRLLDAGILRRVGAYALAGAVAGASLSNYLSALTLKRLFGVYLALVAAKYLFDELQWTLSNAGWKAAGDIKDRL